MLCYQPLLLAPAASKKKKKHRFCFGVTRVSGLCCASRSIEHTQADCSEGFPDQAANRTPPPPPPAFFFLSLPLSHFNARKRHLHRLVERVQQSLQTTHEGKSSLFVIFVFLITEQSGQGRRAGHSYVGLVYRNTRKPCCTMDPCRIAP